MTSPAKKQKITHTEDVDTLRQKAYPPLSDFADAFYWQQRGQPDKMTQWLASCDAVKAKFPKVK